MPNIKKYLPAITLLAASFIAPASVAAAPILSAATDSTNSWLSRRVLHIAHEGGEIEAPSDTMFAFKTA